jgi:uncharacterized membrane protein YjgN (DUF898 family)
VDTGETAGQRIVRPQFTGSAAEYFRIWIVNLFFTLVTLGIYSAWAKVRKKRYFYGATRFDGDSFDYFARPKAILKGRIVAVALFVVYAFTSELYPDARYVFWALLAIALPWLLVRAFSFNARNSAFRGLRFDFAASAKQAAAFYLRAALVFILTAGLAFPWVVARYKAFIVSNHAFGSARFACELPARAFFGIYIRGGLMLMAMMVPLFALMTWLFSRQDLPPYVAWTAYVVPIAGMYGAYAVVYAYTNARATNLQWNSTSGPGVRFSSTLGALKLARLYIGNIVAVACTAGLLIPWAVVRTLRYRFENFAMLLDGNPVHEASPALARVGAIGQEMGDIFNLDLGI